MQPSVGTYFTLYVRDSAGLLRRVGGVRSLDVNPALGTLDGANPDGYGWTYPLPGELSWGVTASGLRLAGGDALARSRAYRLLEDAMWDRTHVDVIATYPNASTKEGRVIVTSLPDQGPDNEPLTGEIELQGVGKLVRTPGLRFFGDGGSYDGGGTWTDRSTYGHHATNGTSGEQPGRSLADPFPFLTFGGDGQRLRVADGTFQPGNAGFTFAGAARFDSDRNHTILGGARDGRTSGPSEIDLDTQDDVTRLSLRIGEAPPLVSPPGSIALGSWFAYLCTYRPGMGRRLVVGGTVTSDDTGDIPRENGEYWIGAEKNQSPLHGAIADLRIWGGALSPTLGQYILDRLKSKYVTSP